MDIIFYIVVPIIAVVIGAMGGLFIERSRRKSFYEEKYWEKQIDFYISLWPSLLELKSSADALWDRASMERLQVFVNRLDNAEKVLQQNKLLIDDDTRLHLLEMLIHEFWRFSSGKARLIDLRDKRVSIVRFDPQEIIQIERNGKTKDRYDRLIVEIEEKFRDKLKNKKHRKIISDLVPNRN